jgi:two-component system sensor histidine kinase ChiS
LISLYYDVLRLAGAVYILIRMASAIKAGRFQARLTLISFVILMASMINDFLNRAGFIDSIRLLWFGVFIFAAQQTYRLMVDSVSDYREFESTALKLSKLTHQKDSFFLRNSIELDKPIRNIIELGESLLKGSIGPLNSEQIASSSLIVSNGFRLTNMVNDILDFSRIKDNDIDLDLASVNLFKICKKVINSCEALVIFRDVELKSEIDYEVPLVQADERRLEQILYNIISNSINHIGKGSIILTSRDHEDAAEILISVSGSNLNEDNVKILFNAYESGENDGVDEQNASDLSLAIAKKLIELHGQAIIIETLEDKLVYTFKLPHWTGERPATEEEELELDALINLQPVFDEITSDRNIEILIAGKDVEELQILKSQLASMNYSVVPMISGSDLLERINTSVPQLVVMDVKLPDMSGYEVCTTIRESYSKDELPVILVINKEDITEVMQGLTSGANDFLTRPYIQEEFLTRVNTHLQLSRISHVYSRFVPTEFLASLGQQNILDVELGDQVSREMTILFVDIRAFTNLSENMTPEENFKFINSYLSRFSPMITNNGGFVDKYIGDAIMALFPDKPEDALAAAREMIEHVNVYNGHRANCNYKPINIGIGIHTGNMILGIIGDEKRMQGTVISDAVNLAARIQDVTKLYKANIVISQETFVKLENPVDYNFRFLGRVKVKGKDKAVALFEIFDSDIEERRKIKNDTKTHFEEGIMKFSRRDFDEAKTLLQKVLDSDPEDLTAAIFIERIDEMKWAEKRDFLTSL